MNKIQYLFRKGLLFLLFIATPFVGYSQGEQLGIRIENRGLSGLNKPSPEEGLPSETEVSALTIGINGSVRKKLDEQKLGLTTLTLGFEYRYTNLSYNQFEPIQGSTLAENLHSARIQIDYMKVFKQKWILSVFLRPGVFGDFQNLDWSQARFEGLALLDYRSNAKSMIGFGVGRSAGFGRTLILPVFHYVYRTPTFMLDALLPSRIDVGWIKDKWFFGLNASIVGNQYQIGDTANQFVGSDRLGVSDFTVGPSIKYNTGKKTTLLLETGMTGSRRWEFRNDDLKGDERFIQKFDPNLTWFVRTGFVIKY